jgi:hypothetical protein
MANRVRLGALHMSDEIVEREREREEMARTSHSLALWYGMLAGPAAGMLMVWINYAAVDRACVSGNRIWLHLLSLLFFLITLLALMVSWRYRNRVGDYPLTEGGVMPRSSFMAIVGLFTASLGLLAIVMQWIPIFFIGSCIGT